MLINYISNNDSGCENSKPRSGSEKNKSRLGNSKASIVGTLLDLIGKIFAKLLNNKLVNHLERNQTLRDSQHGFRRRRGTTTLIANLYERIARHKGTDRRTLITIVTRDVQKAFDKVWHEAITFKLIRAGVPMKLTRILTDFLKNRFAYVRVNTCKGIPFPLLAGVPQGDVLSPTLFLLVGNDYPEPDTDNHRKNFAFQYADDFTQVIVSKFDRKIDRAAKEQHKTNIEREINKQNEFENKWKIKTNINKFHILNVGFYKAPEIRINNTAIPYATHTKLLGLQITRTNFYVKQISTIINRARMELKNLQRFRNLKRSLKARLYKALILPLLTYPAVPLNISSRSQIHQLQVIQNKAIRWIYGEYWPTRCPIQERQVELKLQPIGERLNRLARKVWERVALEDQGFHTSTAAMAINHPHHWFPSSLAAIT